MKTEHGTPYHYHVTVEFEDVDSYQIAHHTKLVAYLERARVRYLVDHGIALHPEAQHPVLYELNVRYKRPATLLDELDISVWTKHIDDFSVTLAYRIHRENRLLLTATTRLGFVDKESKSIAPVPDDYRGLTAKERVE
jgi:acyl-CoA thioester hydrolase